MKTVCKYVRPRRSGRLMTSCGEDSEAGRSSSWFWKSVTCQRCLEVHRRRRRAALRRGVTL
jgi:hypothetical protein